MSRFSRPMVAALALVALSFTWVPATAGTPELIGTVAGRSIHVDGEPMPGTATLWAGQMLVVEGAGVLQLDGGEQVFVPAGAALTLTESPQLTAGAVELRGVGGVRTRYVAPQAFSIVEGKLLPVVPAGFAGACRQAEGSQFDWSLVPAGEAGNSVTACHTRGEQLSPTEAKAFLAGMAPISLASIAGGAALGATMLGVQTGTIGPTSDDDEDMGDASPVVPN